MTAIYSSRLWIVHASDFANSGSAAHSRRISKFLSKGDSEPSAAHLRQVLPMQVSVGVLLEIRVISALPFCKTNLLQRSRIRYPFLRTLPLGAGETSQSCSGSFALLVERLLRDVMGDQTHHRITLPGGIRQAV